MCWTSGVACKPMWSCCRLGGLLQRAEPTPPGPPPLTPVFQGAALLRKLPRSEPQLLCLLSHELMLLLKSSLLGVCLRTVTPKAARCSSPLSSESMLWYADWTCTSSHKQHVAALGHQVPGALCSLHDAAKCVCAWWPSACIFTRDSCDSVRAY